MRLSRRDALAALAALGGGAALAGTARREFVDDPATADIGVDLLAAAEVIYPSAIEVDRSFIDTYVTGRLARRPEYMDEQRAALAALNDTARRTRGRAFGALSVDRREAVLRGMGVQRSHPNPSGTVEERVRYYVVNDLLYALFSTPTGGELVGCENPPGHPGGTQAYQRGPAE